MKKIGLSFGMMHEEPSTQFLITKVFIKMYVLDILRKKIRTQNLYPILVMFSLLNLMENL